MVVIGKYYIKIFIFFLFLLLLSLWTDGCKNSKGQKKRSTEVIHRDWPEIRSRGKLVALTDFNSTDYFIYRGEPMGYQYELLKALSQYLNIDLEIKVENDLDKSFHMLREGDCDIIAINLTITKERKNLIRFTEPIGQTRQVLVQRKPAGWRKMTLDQINKHLIRNPIDLAGKTVYVQKHSSFVERLRHLSDEIGDTIHIIQVDEEVETLIRLVSKGDIDYTIADENVARVNQTYYSILDVSTPVSFPQNLAWGVRKEGSQQLLSVVNNWITKFKKSLDYALIYNKYFKNPKSKVMVKSDYFVLGNGRISPYDDLIKQYSDSLDWDWLILASMIYQESRFNPNVTSWAGAKGLMQIMPSLIERYHVKNPYSPRENIQVGVKYLHWLEEFFSERIQNRDTMVRFVLAAYNTGLGHVLDARSLARKYGEDPSSWEAVSNYLQALSNKKYFLDPVVKYGYCRGDEPVNYVEQIMDRYFHYKNIVRE